MKVAGIQFDIAWEDPEENFRRVEPFIRQAADSGARLVALPEMFATGFSMNSAGSASYHDITCRFLAGAARNFDLWVLGCFVEPGEPHPFNVCALFTPSGKEVMRYRKLHPFTLDGEHEHFAAGDALASHDPDGTRVTPFICYDLRFPEPFRLAADTTDLFVVMANWPVVRAAHWKVLITARAIENQCYVLAVNRVGEGAGKRYSGDSMLVDPFGTTLASASGQAALVSGDVDPEKVASVRSSLSFLQDRRVEVYRAMDEEGRS